MELYVIPFTCSFVAHVACLEAGIPITLQWVDRKTKRLEDGRDFLVLSPKGMVPAIDTPKGVLAESAAVLQWIGDQVPERGLVPAWGTHERYQLIEWLNFVTTELHKKHIWQIFSSKTTDAMKDWARASAPSALDRVEKHLEGREFLLDRLTVADLYLFWILLVAPHGKLALDPWPNLRAYAARIQERPTVKAAIDVESPYLVRERATAA